MAGTPCASDTDARSIFVAIANGTVHRLQSIIPQTSDLNVRDGSLRTPLIASVGISNDESRAHVVRLLVRHGCDVNAQDQTGRTSLMLACQEKDKADVVAVLAKSRDLDPNIQDLDGNSALHLAVESGNVAAIRLLTNVHSAKARLRINQPNHAGLSPLQLAVKLGLADCCRVLIQHGGADTTLIKNRESLLNLINEDRAATPFDSSLGINLDNGVLFDSPLNSARDHNPDNPAGWGTTSRSNSELFRVGSRANSSTSLTRPSSDLHSARESARMRLENYSRVSDSISRNNSRGYDRDFSGKSSAANNPFADVMREKSDLYVQNSRTTFKKSIVPKKLGGVQQSHGDWLRQNLNARRPLTPIASRTITEEQCQSPVHTSVPHPGRLPSIPSGKRLCLVSPRETPTELF
ncbi:ankyrin repeat domain-containing protein 63 [Plakobranchus ocellatus]|uniref:Ankyrin repeat domain-containing protein 63 n=1 Tax=Plakobranchus ocellatus TaxID=259542 RepID=A0AAV3ZLR1_9GAST|nr:ankyrin repeat domain-containing protein 63 [Plakobranchus ocellatus]